MAKPLLWLATLAVAALALFPSYGTKLIGKSATSTPGSAATLQTAALKITGMDCEVCAGALKRRLLETRGVVQVEVNYPSGRAAIKYDPTRTNTTELIAAIDATGYKASVQDR